MKTNTNGPVRQVNVLLEMGLHGAAALVLQQMGYTFNEAHYIIFNEYPRYA